MTRNRIKIAKIVKIPPSRNFLRVEEISVGRWPRLEPHARHAAEGRAGAGGRLPQAEPPLRIEPFRRARRKEGKLEALTVERAQKAAAAALIQLN